MTKKHLSGKVKLSVAVITYNQEQTIAKTLDSILQQEHGYSYEIVIGEDCSTDRTRDILLEYQLRYPDVIRLLLNEKNIGLIRNYFNVIEHCQGEYIMQCAGDDWWLPGKVALQIPYMDNHPECGMCYTKAAEFIQEQERQKGYWGGRYTEFGDLIRANTVPALTVVMRNVLLNRYIDEICPLYREWRMEDYPLWLWMSRESKIHFMDEITAVYRVLVDSLSHSNNVEYEIAFAHNVIDIKTYFYNQYTTERFNAKLHKWRSSLSLYAKHNQPNQLFSIWFEKVDTDMWAFICGFKYIVIYMLVRVKLYPLLCELKKYWTYL